VLLAIAENAGKSGPAQIRAAGESKEDSRKIGLITAILVNRLRAR
jgi:hypothetical protein